MIVFDLMRGYFLFGIVVNHLDLFPNFLAIFTGATRLWVSFAEGFFIVSGFFIGFLYKDAIKKSFLGVFKKLSVRSLRLYLWTVYLSLLFTYWGNLMPRGLVKTGLWIVNWGNVSDLILNSLSLKYTYGWADILPYYAVYIFFSSFYLWFLKKRKWYLLLLGNLFLWYFHGTNIYLAIQPLFFLGVITGYYSDNIQKYWMSFKYEFRFKTKTIIYGTFLISLFASVFSVFFFDKVFQNMYLGGYFIAKNRVLNLYFDKQYVGIFRLILAPFWFVAGMFIFSSFEKYIERYFGWLFLPFGKNSLYAYILHAFVIYPIPYLVYRWGLNGFWWNSIMTVFSVYLMCQIFYFTPDRIKRKF